MRTTISKVIEPIIANQIRDKIVSGNRSIKALALDYAIGVDHLGLQQSNINFSQRVFGLTELEKIFIIKIYKMTRLPAEELYDSLTQFFPSLTVGGINDCIKLSRVYQT